MARPVANPIGAWPLEIAGRNGCGFCDEPSVEAFHAKVRQGMYSEPSRAKGSLPKWHRERLERDIARRHGLKYDGPTLAENVEESDLMPRKKPLGWPDLMDKQSPFDRRDILLLVAPDAGT